MAAGDRLRPTRPLPCLPLGVPPGRGAEAAAGRRRLNERALTRSGFVMNRDAGGIRRRSRRAPPAWPRRQPVELVPDDVARGQELRRAVSRAATGRRVFVAAARGCRRGRRGHSSRSSTRRRGCWWMRPGAAPGGTRICCACVVGLLLLLRVLAGRRLEVGCLSPGAVTACSRTPARRWRELSAIGLQRSRTPRSRRACSCPGRRRSRRRARRRSRSRSRSGRRAGRAGPPVRQRGGRRGVAAAVPAPVRRRGCAGSPRRFPARRRS